MKKLLVLLPFLFLFAFTEPQPQTLTMRLTVPELNIIIKALSKLPYDESAEIINTIQAQAQKQLSDTTKPKK